MAAIKRQEFVSNTRGSSSGTLGTGAPPPPAVAPNPYDTFPGYAFTGKGPDGVAGKLVKFSIIYGAGAVTFPSLAGSGVPDESVKFALMNDGYGNTFTMAVTGYDWTQVVDGDGNPINHTGFYGSARAAYKFVANALRAANGWELIDVDDADPAHNDTAGFLYGDENDPNNIQTEWKNGTDLVYPVKDWPRNLFPELDAMPRTIVWWPGGGELRMLPVKLNELRDDQGNLQWAGIMFAVVDRVTRTGYFRQSAYPVAIKNQLGGTIGGGASLGASIGSAILPIVGTLVGGLIGAIAGLFVGLGLNAAALDKAIQQVATSEPTVLSGVAQGAQGVQPGSKPGSGDGKKASDSTLLYLAGGLALLALLGD